MITNAQKLDAIKLFQQAGRNGEIHPLTCGKDSQHILEGVERNGNVELQCPQCVYKQRWVPPIVYEYFTCEDYE